MDARPGVPELAGWGRLAVGIVRRDRLRLAIWLVAVPAIALPTLSAYAAMSETGAGGQARAALMATPTGTVFGGPGYGLDDYTSGAMIANELLLYLVSAVALAAVTLVVHMTRHEEELGRLELVGAAVVGRRAALAAAVAVVSVEVVAIGLAIGAGMLAIPGLPNVDCLAFGLAIAAVGLAFSAIGALAAQLATTGRGAAAIGVGTVGGAFLLRAFGDTATARDAPDWASWVSPLGWANRTRVFVDLMWWPILLALVFAAGVAWAAWAVAARRDMGAGLAASQPGPARAAKNLLHPSGLVWRRTRGALYGWAGGGAILGLCMGPVMAGLGDYLENNPTIAGLFGVDPRSGLNAAVEAFSAVIVLYMAILMAVFVILGLNQFKADEARGFVELELAGPVSRPRLLGATEATIAMSALLGLAFAGTTYLLVVSTDQNLDPATAPGIGGAVLRAFPGLILTAALASFLVAALPRLAALSWLPLAYSFAHAVLAPAFGWPNWTRYFAPLSAVDLSPGEAIDWRAVAVAGVLAIVLFKAAHVAFKRRDIAT
ncbi:MAG: hypothetical protein LBD97_10675 [Bifidobacteriaceae bacterium]|nr:hypothetical protein [Bifidobacteriaceae bacterium]